jgi:hypothetical protein
MNAAGTATRQRMSMIKEVWRVARMVRCSLVSPAAVRRGKISVAITPGSIVRSVAICEATL